MLPLVERGKWLEKNPSRFKPKRWRSETWNRARIPRSKILTPRPKGTASLLFYFLSFHPPVPGPNFTGMQILGSGVRTYQGSAHTNSGVLPTYRYYGRCLPTIPLSLRLEPSAAVAGRPRPPGRQPECTRGDLRVGVASAKIFSPFAVLGLEKNFSRARGSPRVLSDHVRPHVSHAAVGPGASIALIRSAAAAPSVESRCWGRRSDS